MPRQALKIHTAGNLVYHASLARARAATDQHNFGSSQYARQLIDQKTAQGLVATTDQGVIQPLLSKPLLHRL